METSSSMFCMVAKNETKNLLSFEGLRDSNSGKK